VFWTVIIIIIIIIIPLTIFYTVITIVSHMQSRTVNIIAMYCSLCCKFCSGGLVMVCVDRNMWSC